MEKVMMGKVKSLQRRNTLRRISDLTQAGFIRLERLSSISTRRPRASRWGVLGVKRTLGDDTAFIMLDMDWLSLLLFVLAVYAAVSIIFGIIFCLCMALLRDGEHMLGELSPHLSWPEACLWLSVTNLTTVGYGSITPETRLGYALCTAEHFCGLIMSSLLLGVVVTKASIPTAKIVFSKVCLITTRNGVPHLLVRIGNIRGNFLLKPEIRMFYMQRLVTVEGEVTYRGKRLEVSEPHALAPSLILSHEIDEASPLHGVRDADIREADGAVCVSVAAVDDHSLQEVYAKIVFRGDDVRWNHRFCDVLIKKGGQFVVDFRTFHETTPISVANKGMEGTALAAAAKAEVQEQAAEAAAAEGAPGGGGAGKEPKEERQALLPPRKLPRKLAGLPSVPLSPSPSPGRRASSDEEGDEVQHADLLRHGRMTSLEHSTAHLMVDRNALRSALADNAALQRGSVLARLRRHSMLPSLPEHHDEAHRQGSIGGGSGGKTQAKQPLPPMQGR